MSAVLPLDKMSVAEKIGMMESLWDDLLRDEDAIRSPSWHGDVLSRRDEAVRTGAERVLDWSDAKKRIRESIS